MSPDKRACDRRFGHDRKSLSVDGPFAATLFRWRSPRRHSLSLLGCKSMRNW